MCQLEAKTEAKNEPENISVYNFQSMKSSVELNSI